MARFGETGAAVNAELGSRPLRSVARPDPDGRALLVAAGKQLAMSGRAHDRVLRVARTLADLERSASVRAPHVAEAVQLRRLGSSG